MNDQARNQEYTYETHKEKLEIKHCIVGHPMADQLYKLAWQIGHSCGFNEIESYYDDIAFMVKNDMMSIVVC